jgi:predicted O-methyltransferase YrrM
MAARLRRRTAESAQARAEIRRLRRHGTPDALLLADLVRRGTRWRLDAEERAWAERIENARRSLERSDETVRRRAGTAVAVGDVARRASQPRRGGRLLYAVVRAFAPTHGVELGTCVGVSAAYQAAALTANGSGRLVTLEGYPDLAVQAEKLWSDLGLHNVQVVVGRFAQTLEPVIATGPLDYAYIDGNHHEDPTVHYFTRLRDQCRSTTLLVFDDIRWSEGMRRAWHRISTDAAVTGHADLGRIGLVIVQPRP